MRTAKVITVEVGSIPTITTKINNMEAILLITIWILVKTAEKLAKIK